MAVVFTMSSLMILKSLLSVKHGWTLYTFYVFCSNEDEITVLEINENFQRKTVNIFLPIRINICSGCSKELSH